MMNTLQDVPLAQAYRLLNHGPTVLVSSAHAGQQNVMAAAWAMPLDFDPPKILVVIDKATHTRKLMEASGEFALNVPCRYQAQAVVAAGSASGADCDKFAASGLQAMPAQRIAAPLVQGCSAYLECRIIQEPHNQQQYDLFIAEVVAAQADSRVFSNGRWHFDGHDALRSLHHVAGGHFFVSGDTVSGQT
ncbi:flavin reductase family protein [Vogesella mureinivorans]|uniref:flavin reductase family protein n=1 Tax=Vogesella mureinivorans TaxID=657276 RepID=UPI0011CBD91D|nr:flavin reductase family protein [Vogesella mureinivorans]